MPVYPTFKVEYGVQICARLPGCIVAVVLMQGLKMREPPPLAGSAHVYLEEPP